MQCQACETRFSRLETPFARNIFQPVTSGSPLDIPYGDYLLPFLISVLWRNLAVDLAANQEIRNVADGLQRVEESWRNYLLNGTSCEPYNRVHMLCVDMPLAQSPQISEYLARECDATAMYGDSVGLMGYYAKFGRFVAIADFNLQSDAWKNTLVDAAGGTVLPFSIGDSGFVEFLMDRAARFRGYRVDLESRMSPRQREAAIVNIQQLGEKFQTSEQFRTMVRDRIWTESIPKVGRNTLCPCGSGRKHKGVMALSSG
ncbi:MAG: SEC-C metal-binding domain-containing protein [Acidobacteriota bacterium]